MTRSDLTDHGQGTNVLEDRVQVHAVHVGTASSDSHVVLVQVSPRLCLKCSGALLQETTTLLVLLGALVELIEFVAEVLGDRDSRLRFFHGNDVPRSVQLDELRVSLRANLVEDLEDDERLLRLGEGLGVSLEVRTHNGVETNHSRKLSDGAASSDDD